MILVTGASGFVGRAVAMGLVARGWAVRGAVRDGTSVIPGIETVAVGDLSQSIDWARVVAGIDCVVHCAGRAHMLREDAADPLAAFRAINRDATLHLAEAAATAGVRRFIFMSSAHVCGVETQDRPFASSDAPHPQSPYAVVKLEAEQQLTELGRHRNLEIVIIRPPLVIGPGPKGNLGVLLAAMRRGLPLPLRQVTTNRRDLVSLETLTDLVERCTGHPGAPGGVLLVSDGHPLSTRQIVEQLAMDAGLKPRLLSVPPLVLKTLLTALGRSEQARQLLGNFELDIAETKRRLDWTPPRKARA